MKTESAANMTNPTTATPGEEPASKIFRLVVFAVIAVVAIVGNTVVCKSVLETSSYKRTAYLLVANLAVAEIVSTLFYVLAFISEYLVDFPFGPVGCTIIVPVQVSAMFVVTSTLAAIAYFRFYYVSVGAQPAVAHRRMPVGIMVALLWVLPTLFCLPLFLYHEMGHDEDGRYCWPNWPSKEIQHSYNIARFVFNFLLPCLVMILSYGAVAWKLRRHARRARENSIEFGPPSEGNGGVSRESLTSECSSWIIEMEHDLVRMFYLVIAIFLVCYIPYQIYYIYWFFRGGWAEPSHTYVKIYLDLLGAFPSALHPICYGTKSRFFAKAFNKLVLCRR